jgi:cancer susceptibility candidate protein 1
VMGIWVSGRQCWLPEGTSDFLYDRSTRKATFLSQNLTKMAIIQEKGFDVPYERWFLYPVDNESVTFVIEGKRRNDISDREVHILVRNNLCKLLNPQDPELQYLREEWYTPASLLRLLSNSGFNFVLQESDSTYIPDILPKIWAMENKAYDDIALFCTTMEFASSTHNKCGEDPNMCLFRVSKRMRDLESSEAFSVELSDDEQWYTVRYERDRCSFTKCKETDVEANLEELPGHEVHLNLYMIMKNTIDAELTDQCIGTSDLLLQNAVKQLLMLIRPLTWG